MADEMTLMWETAPAIPYKVADGAGIEKGSLLKLAESMTAIITSGAKDPIAGVLKTEKILNDGQLTVPVYTEGYFKAVAEAAILIGAPLSAGATPNRLQTATGTNGATIIGYAVEAPSGAGQTFIARINVGTGGEVA